jgi:F420H(2)-dependent quinone reductase
VGETEQHTGTRSLPLEQSPHPPAIAAKLGVRFFTFLLKSPLHRLLPHDLVLLTVTRRETGEARTFPVEYHEVDGRMAVLSTGRWPNDVRGGADVTIQLGGKPKRARADVVDDPDEVTRIYQKLLAHVGFDKAEKIDLVVKERREPTFDELKAAVAGTSIVFLELPDRG